MQATPAPTEAPGSPSASLIMVEDLEPPPQNVDTAPFSVLVKLFQRLQVERKHDKRRKMLDSWFSHWRSQKGYDLYPVLRLLLPQKDKERAVYGLKEKAIAKIYIKLIPLGSRDPDALRLMNWKKPIDRGRTSGDFPVVLAEVVSKRSSVIEGSLSIDELNDLLDELCECQGKQAEQLHVMTKIYNRTTAEEQRWIAHIILKDMVISVKETTIFSVFHPDAQDLYNTCSDLKKVTWELWDTGKRLKSADKEIKLFRAFAPMLCKRPTKKIEETVKAMGGGEFIIEEKLDGERMQIHKRGNEYFYSSRKGKDYTYLYGKIPENRNLTSHIHSAFHPKVKDIVLDGEMLVWDPISERNLPFGSLKTAAAQKVGKEAPRPCFKVFDILYLNGKSLLNNSTAKRRDLLRFALKEVPGHVEHTVQWTGTTAKDIRKKMNDIMEKRGEGLVIKHPKAMYLLNGRNLDWIKVKPEYMDNMGETVDLLVVGGYYGTRKRSGGVSTLVCALFDDRRQYQDDEEPIYSTFVRIGTGLSFSDYVWIRSLPWKPWNPNDPPKFLQTSKKSNSDDKGDVYIEPSDSFIIKVKAAEITPSDGYHMGFTMRFPRAISIREDLTVADCQTVSSVLENIRSEKKRTMDDSNQPAKKRKTGKTAKQPVLQTMYGGIGKDTVDSKSDLFEGMTFVVMTDPKSRTKEDEKKELTTLIYENGGKCTQTVRKAIEDLFIVYDGKTKPYDLTLQIRKGVVDVIKPSWLRDSAEAGERVPMTRKYFYHATDARKAMPDYGEDEEGPGTASDSATEDDDEATESEPVAEDVVMSEPPEAKETPAEEEEGQKDEPAVEEEMDPDLAEWFKIDLSSDVPGDDGDGSATEEDSENEDTRQDEEPEPDLDDWFAPSETLPTLPTAEVTMGEADDAMEYDQVHIFRHLCFYLDSPENATKHGLPVTTKYVKSLNKSFGELVEQITANGGRVVDLDEPKLTHVVIDKRDTSRRDELLTRTSQPKRRYLVTPEFVRTCLDEETLLDETDFAA